MQTLDDLFEELNEVNANEDAGLHYQVLFQLGSEGLRFALIEVDHDEEMITIRLTKGKG